MLHHDIKLQNNIKFFSRLWTWTMLQWMFMWHWTTSGTMIKFLPLDFLSVSRRVPWKNENAVYHLQISALVPEIFKFEKCVKYANKMTDDVIHSTQYYIKHINGAILASLQCRTLKLGRLIVLQKTHLWL